MLKKIALLALLAVGTAFGAAAARAATSTAKKVPVPAAPQGFCPKGTPC